MAEQGGISRILLLQKQREMQEQLFNESKEKLEDSSDKMLVEEMDNKFLREDDSMKNAFKKKTIGLVSKKDFTKYRQEIEKMEKEQERAKQRREEKRRRNEKKRKRKQKSLLSFSDDITDDNINDKDNNDNDDEPEKKKVKLIKNPEVDTSLLPDKEREEREAMERKKLELEWLEKQEKIKNEQIDVTYSYWDGTGHRRSLTVTKGTSIQKFLQLVQQEFKELQRTSVDNLLFVKEDVIIPMHYTFYDLIVTKARGKSGPLFHFDVHDDIRLVNDASVEKEESHAAKVVERRWYERNKHIFPASRWEVYDPTKDYEKYTIR
eukprot:gb/GECH01014349.1/.p1 GENE.gb/GECH01014349.1/~~gb/GECH01014349.1/.p1  ORF type:complete len:321 (+),score=120.23 gb/GECH01014349.1/:1-963(+)